MPAYHSQFNEKMERGQPIPSRNIRYIGSLPILPIKTAKFKGPAPPCDRGLSFFLFFYFSFSFNFNKI